MDSVLDRIWEFTRWIVGGLGLALMLIWRGLERRVTELEEGHQGITAGSATQTTDLAVLKSRFEALTQALTEHREETRRGFESVLSKLDRMPNPGNARTPRKPR